MSASGVSPNDLLRAIALPEIACGGLALLSLLLGVGVSVVIAYIPFSLKVGKLRRTTTLRFASRTALGSCRVRVHYVQCWVLSRLPQGSRTMPARRSNPGV
jgi:hypothetical protein